MTEALQFGQQKLDVLSLHSGIRDYISEKVWLISERLVADHQGAGVHHSRFELGGDLVRTVAGSVRTTRERSWPNERGRQDEQRC